MSATTETPFWTDARWQAAKRRRVDAYVSFLRAGTATAEVNPFRNGTAEWANFQRVGIAAARVELVAAIAEQKRWERELS